MIVTMMMMLMAHGTWQGEKRRVGSQMAAFKKSAAVRSSAWRDFDPSLRQEFSQEGTFKMKFIEILSKMIARYWLLPLLQEDKAYPGRGQNLLEAIKCKQTSWGCESTTGNDHYLKGYQTQMEQYRKPLRKRNPEVKHQSINIRKLASVQHKLRGPLTYVRKRGYCPLHSGGGGQSQFIN